MFFFIVPAVSVPANARQNKRAKWVQTNSSFLIFSYVVFILKVTLQLYKIRQNRILRKQGLGKKIYHGGEVLYVIRNSTP